MLPLATLVGKARSKFLQDSKLSVEASGIDTINGVIDAWEAAGALTSETSLSEFTKVANLEPRVMVEDTLITLPNLEKILLGLTNLYSAYYLQSISLNGTINGVSAISVLDRFNPNREASMTKLIKHIQNTTAKPKSTLYGKLAGAFSKESYQFVLPNYKEDTPPIFNAIKEHGALEGLPPHLAAKLAREQETQAQQTSNQNVTVAKPVNPLKEQYDKMKDTNNLIAERNKVGDHERGLGDTIKGLKNIQEADNLAVGRLIEVDLNIDGRLLHIPVSVRVRPMSVPQPIMKELVSLGDIRNSWKERWHRMRSGELSLISDWIFQSDVIRHKRKLMALDKKGLYRELMNRRKNNKQAAIASGHVSIGAASAFILLSERTAREVEMELGQPLSNPEFRKRVFGENSAMMILIFDTEWERIRGYTRGIDGEVNYSFKSFENIGSKSGGPDIAEIMKAYTMGSNPRF